MRSSIVESAIYYEEHWSESRQMDFVQRMLAQKGYFLFKRGFDITVAALVSLLVFPWLMPLVIILIRLDSKGPIFFMQERTGFLGKTFFLL